MGPGSIQQRLADENRGMNCRTKHSLAANLLSDQPMIMIDSPRLTNRTRGFVDACNTSSFITSPPVPYLYYSPACLHAKTAPPHYARALGGLITYNDILCARVHVAERQTPTQLFLCRHIAHFHLALSQPLFAPTWTISRSGRPRAGAPVMLATYDHRGEQ